MPIQFTISELAKEFNVTTRTIRFYEDKGMLQPQRVGQRRIYNSRDQTRLKLILRGKRIGLSLNESKEIIDLYQNTTADNAQLHALLEAVKKQREVLNIKKKALIDMEEALNKVEEKCRYALSAN